MESFVGKSMCKGNFYVYNEDLSLDFLVFFCFSDSILLKKFIQFFQPLRDRISKNSSLVGAHIIKTMCLSDDRLNSLSRVDESLCQLVSQSVKTSFNIQLDIKNIFTPTTWFPNYQPAGKPCQYTIN